MRDRAWRRAQRERVRDNRVQLAKVLWSWSYETRPDWLAEVGRTWTKINPFTACSCGMCRWDRNVRHAPDASEWEY